MLRLFGTAPRFKMFLGDLPKNGRSEFALFGSMPHFRIFFIDLPKNCKSTIPPVWDDILCRKKFHVINQKMVGHNSAYLDPYPIPE